MQIKTHIFKYSQIRILTDSKNRILTDTNFHALTIGVFNSFSIMDFEFLNTLKPFAKTLYINDKGNLSDCFKVSK